MTQDFDSNNSTLVADVPVSAPTLIINGQDALTDLPSADTKRWVVRRKEQVVQAVQAGRLTREQACERYRLSEEEYQSWENHLLQHGLRGLRVTRLQDYRRHDAPAEVAETASRRRVVLA